MHMMLSAQGLAFGAQVIAIIPREMFVFQPYVDRTGEGLGCPDGTVKASKDLSPRALNSRKVNEPLEEGQALRVKGACPTAAGAGGAPPQPLRPPL